MIVAIQAGGRSSRMGQDKAWLTIGGETLISRVLAAARAVSDHLLIVTRKSSVNHNAYIDLAREQEAELVYDLEDNGGPLAGIHAALRHSGQSETVLVLACDLPFVTAEFLEFLSQEHTRGERMITVPHDTDGRPQPLLAIYSGTCIPQIENHLARGILRVDRLFEVLPTYHIQPEAYSHLEDPWRIFSNINTPADLTEVENEVRSRGAEGR